jgi:hypothetical protein
VADHGLVWGEFSKNWTFVGSAGFYSPASRGPEERFARAQPRSKSWGPKILPNIPKN